MAIFIIGFLVLVVVLVALAARGRSDRRTGGSNWYHATWMSGDGSGWGGSDGGSGGGDGGGGGGC